MAQLAPLKVLIVEDSQTDCIIFRRHLTRGVAVPCEIRDAPTATLAMQLLSQELPDCVLLDFNLPDSDGVSLVKKIVESYGEHAFGIVMLTSNQEVERAVEAMQSGAHDFVPKASVNAIVLRRAVENAAEKAGIQRQLEIQRLALAQKNEELETHVRRLEQEAAERLLAEARLRQSEQQLRVVTDHADVLLARFDLDCRYKYVNRPYAERFGLDPEYIVGKEIREVLGKDAFIAVQPHLKTVLAGERVEFEIEIPYAKLGLRWVSVVYVPERALDGSVIGFIGLKSDVTARKRSAMELEHARDEALAASRAKDDFVAALSHELRTPLNPILLLSSEAANDPEIPEPVRAIFETIRKNVELEARLIDDLLNITRISRGKMVLERVPVDLHTVIADAVANVAPEIDAKHLALKQELHAANPMVMGDAVRLQQVFWNVLKNAVKFTPEGGIITLATTSLPEKKAIEIRITDSGIGISGPELERIFDAFSQGDHAGEGGSHRFGGLGLGLAICQMLVQSHSGSIQARSNGPGEGATFIISLPSSTDTCDRVPSPVQQRVARPAGTKVTRVLLVEDHEPTRSALTQLLTRRRYQIQAAGSVRAALELAASHEYDLLISDIGLPDGNGYELMKEVARLYGLKGIALSGYGMEKDLGRSEEAGFVLHLTKPVQMQSLDQAIKTAMAAEPKLLHADPAPDSI
ncbi:response regulator [Prosthecobacter sp. SYSU 5D2]|uniref:hybrid sensor histidine kinase/response regulator n=1 Tax=Prosthecobacter sp. SYSU 5D2 TaxID=3134134 RepID=UPI0031FE8839